MQSTLELIKALFASINSAYLIMADKKLDGSDLAFILPLIFKWQEGIKDLTFAKDAANATEDSIENLFKLASVELNAVPTKQRYAIVNMVKGYYCTYWIIAGHTVNAMIKEIDKHGPAAVIQMYSAA